MSVSRMLMGVETEYAVTVFSSDARTSGAGGFQELYEGIHEQVPSLPDSSSSGLFLANGARFYHDSGHSEYATPECESPREVLAAIRAGERLLTRASTRAGTAHNREIAVFRSNVDYGGTQATWGCHESYLHRSHPDSLPQQLIPHLVSRTIYTGAGGFVPDEEGIEFTLSPRSSKLECAVSGTSTATRGIFHTKDETLSCEGYHRLHVICGESLCESLGTLLKVGTTALIVAAIDAGWCMAPALSLRSPVDALRVIAGDHTFRRPVATTRGHRVTAIEIQREYLGKVEACRAAGQLPPWADEICTLWADALDHLESNDGWANRALDWGLKQTLFERWVGGRPIWEGLSTWNLIWRYVRTQLAATPDFGPQPHHWSIRDVCAVEANPTVPSNARLSKYLASKGTDWAGLREFLTLRQELFEIDVRYGQLGSRGIHEQLVAQGLAGPPLVTDAEIANLVTDPPAGGRAMARGQLIRALRGAEPLSPFGCNWTRVWDHRDRRFVDLSDPFGTEVVWQRQEHAEARATMRDFCRGVWTDFF